MLDAFPMPAAAPVLPALAMRAADRATIEDFGIPSFALMETAALAACEAIEERFGPAHGLAVIVFAGKGGNGGDGLAMARILTLRGARLLCVTTAGVDGTGPDTARNLDLLRKLEDDPHVDLELIDRAAERGEDDLARATMDFGASDLCIDALLGIGQTSAPRGAVGLLSHWSAAHGPVVAIDVPTGVNGDTGEVLAESAVIADLTVAMGAAKPGLLFGEGRTHSGEVVVADIGIPPHVLREGLALDGSALIPSDGWIESLLPWRPVDAHKFSAGQVLCVAGSDTYPGAAAMAARAASRVGAGYVVCATTDRAKTAIDGVEPEIACVVRAPGQGGAAELIRTHHRAAALLIGPGLGRGDEVVDLVQGLLEACPCPMVIDADGLNALADGVGLGVLRRVADGGRIVLTPHPGEAARLEAAAGLDSVPTTPTLRAKALARALGCVVVLKGSPTVTAAPDLSPAVIARHAEPALATAGAGDVLAGMIAGLVAQGASPEAAAVAAVHIGGAVAEEWSADNSARAMIASDMIEALPEVIGQRFEHES